MSYCLKEEQFSNRIAPIDSNHTGVTDFKNSSVKYKVRGSYSGSDFKRPLASLLIKSFNLNYLKLKIST